MDLTGAYSFWFLGDYKEGYYIGVEVPEDDPKAQKPFFGPNIWPSEGRYLKLPMVIMQSFSYQSQTQKLKDLEELTNFLYLALNFISILH